MFMKKFLIFIFVSASFSAKAQTADTTKASAHKYSPGHYFKLAGNNLIIGTSLSLVSGVAIVTGSSGHAGYYESSKQSLLDLLVVLGIVGEAISLTEYISAGINLHRGGKRMIELKMGMLSDINQVGVMLVF